MLTMRDFVVGGFDLESHAFQDIDDRATRVFAEIGGCEIEIGADVVRDRRRLFVRPRLEHEELGFHSRVHRVAEFRCPRDYFLENGAGITGERLAVRSIDVANDSGDTTPFISPWKDLKSAEVRSEEHVGLFDAHESFDR